MVSTKLCTALSALALLPWGTEAAVGYDFAKVKKQAPPKARSRSLSVELVNEEFLYLVNISIGTPPQHMSVQLDTGSSDLWVPSAVSKFCKAAAGSCEITGSFDSSASSSFELVKGAKPFEVIYGDESMYEGNYFVDTLQIGDTVVKNVTMAIVDRAQNIVEDKVARSGVWGISFPSSKASTNLQGDQPDQSILQNMKKDGIIKSASYSLWLNSIDAKSGTILFGGVDSAKFTPPLTGVSIIKTSDSQDYICMCVELTFLSLKGPSGDSTLTDDDTVAVALLDSGTTMTILPSPLAMEIYSQFGVQSVQPESGSPLLPCSLAKEDGSITFGFGGANGPKITVPIDAFMDAPSGSHQFADGTEACRLLIDASYDDILILGDSFLRSAYVVYDLENHQIALAQSNLHPGAPKIAEIDGSTIPYVTSVASAVAQPGSFSEESDATKVPSWPTELPVPSGFDGGFIDSALEAVYTIVG